MLQTWVSNFLSGAGLWEAQGGDWEESVKIKVKKDDKRYAEILGRIFANKKSFVDDQNRVGVEWGKYLGDNKKKMDVILDHEKQKQKKMVLNHFDELFIIPKNFKKILTFLILYEGDQKIPSRPNPNDAWDNVSPHLIKIMIFLGGIEHLRNVFENGKKPIDWLKEIKDPGYCFFKLFSKIFKNSEKMLGRWVWEKYNQNICLNSQKVKEIWETEAHSDNLIENYLNQLKKDEVDDETIRQILNEKAQISPQNIYELKNVMLSGEISNDDVLLGLWPLLINMHKDTTVGNGEIIDFKNNSTDERLRLLEEVMKKSSDPKTVGTGSFSIQTDPQFVNYYYRAGPCSAIEEEEQRRGKSHIFDIPKKLLGCGEIKDRIVQPTGISVKAFSSSTTNIVNLVMKEKKRGDYLAILGQAAGMLGMKIPDEVKNSAIVFEAFKRSKLPKDYKKKETFKVKFEDDIYVDGEGLGVMNFGCNDQSIIKNIDSKALSADITALAFVTDVVYNSKITKISPLNLYFALENIFKNQNQKFKHYWAEDR